MSGKQKECGYSWTSEGEIHTCSLPEGHTEAHICGFVFNPDDCCLERAAPTPPEGEAVTEQPNRAHFSLSPAEAHETVAGKENLTMKNFVIAFHVCCETKEQAHQWRMSALQILDQNTHALGYKPDETGDLNCHCSGHADEENGEEEIPLIPAPVVSTAAPEPPPNVWRFDRYRNGRKMAEGIIVNRAKTPQEAWEIAKSMADTGDELREHPVAPESYKPAEGPEKICGMSVDDKGTKCRKKPLHRGRCSVHPEPAATPVTVEAPLLNRENFLSPLTQAACAISQLSNDSYRKKQIVSIAEAEEIIKGYGLSATPKPIGDVEALLDELATSPDKTYCQRGRDELRAILSPFFAPAGPEKEKK